MPEWGPLGSVRGALSNECPYRDQIGRLAAPNLADLEVAERNQVSREGAAMAETTPSPLNNVITIDDERIKNHLDRVVRGSVEETLNALLDAEADRLCNAQRYERSAARRDTLPPT